MHGYNNQPAQKPVFGNPIPVQSPNIYQNPANLNQPHNYNPNNYPQNYQQNNTYGAPSQGQPYNNVPQGQYYAPQQGQYYAPQPQYYAPQSQMPNNNQYNQNYK